MKNLLTLFVLFLGLGMMNAQNKQETLKWLNQHKKYITAVNSRGNSSKKFEVEMTDSFIRAETKSDGKKYETKLYWSQIKETFLGILHDENGYVTLYTEDHSLFAPSITLYISNYSSEMRENLTRMATMSGTDVLMR